MWFREDIAPIARTLVITAPCPEFAAGVMALAAALGVEDVRMPEARRWPRIVVIQENGQEV